MKLNRRKLIAGASAVTAAGALGMTSVSTGQAQDGALQIEYWHRQSGDAALAIESAAAAFNEAFAGEIEVLPVAQGDIATLTQKVRAAAAGGGLPAALMADDADILSYYSSEIIVPLDTYLDDPEYGLSDEDRADFLPNQLDRHKLSIYDDNTMTYPIGFSTYGFFWNQDAVSNAGMSEPPKTWEEFPDAVRAIAAANPGMVFNTQSDLGPVLIFLMSNHRVSWLKENGIESNFDAPEVLDILTWISELAAEGVLVPDSAHTDLFIAQSNMFVLQSSTLARRLNNEVTEFTWGGGLPPQASLDVDPLTELFGPLNTIPKTDEETQMAGWRWLKWLTEPAMHAQYNAAAGYFPARYSAAEESALVAYYATNPIHGEMFETVAPYARIPDQGPGLIAIRGSIASNTMSELVLGRLTPEEAQLKLKAEADAEIEAAS